MKRKSESIEVHDTSMPRRPVDWGEIKWSTSLPDNNLEVNADNVKDNQDKCSCGHLAREHYGERHCGHLGAFSYTGENLKGKK